MKVQMIQHIILIISLMYTYISICYEKHTSTNVINIYYFVHFLHGFALQSDPVDNKREVQVSRGSLLLCETKRCGRVVCSDIHIYVRRIRSRRLRLSEKIHSEERFQNSGAVITYNPIDLRKIAYIWEWYLGSKRASATVISTSCPSNN